MQTTTENVSEEKIAKHRQFIQELREAADFLEQHPEIEITEAYIFSVSGTKDGAYVFAKARGDVKKSSHYEGTDSEEFRLDWYSPSRVVHLSYSVKKRDCCEKRVVTKEVVEYACDPILSLGGAA